MKEKIAKFTTIAILSGVLGLALFLTLGVPAFLLPRPEPQVVEVPLESLPMVPVDPWRIAQTQAATLTEDSFLWTTGSDGDGAATYTRADWSNVIKAACPDGEGVTVGALNELTATVTTNLITLNTGYAVVDG